MAEYNKDGTLRMQIDLTKSLSIWQHVSWSLVPSC